MKKGREAENERIQRDEDTEERKATGAEERMRKRKNRRREGTGGKGRGGEAEATKRQGEEGRRTTYRGSQGGGRRKEDASIEEENIERRVQWERKSVKTEEIRKNRSKMTQTKRR